jgi:hypothetical protein
MRSRKFGSKKIYAIGIFILLTVSVFLMGVSSALTIKTTEEKSKNVIMPPKPVICGDKTKEIESNYNGYVKKTDKRWPWEDYKYEKFTNSYYILVGHNKKPLGYDKHFKGFIEWDLTPLKNIWNEIEYIKSAQVEFYTSDYNGDEFEKNKDTLVGVYNLDVRPSESDAKTIWKYEFDDERLVSTLTCRQKTEPKDIDIDKKIIENRIKQNKNWLVIGLKCLSDVDEGEARGAVIYGSYPGYYPILIITYKKKSSPIDNNYVLLVEGGIGDELQSCFKNTVNYAYRVFKEDLGYDSDNIRKLNYPSKKDDVKDAITNWLRKHSTSKSDCFIYMIDHGSNGGYFWINGRESISPRELDSWISTVTYNTLTIVMESCFSGDFMRQLRGKNRIVITSTDRNKVSFGVGGGYALFSKAFFDKLKTKSSYGEAWESADAYVDTPMLVTFRVFILQNPKIDDHDRCYFFGDWRPNKLPSDTLALKVYPVPT